MAPAWSGTAATGVTWIDRLKRLGTPVVAQVGQMPYSAMLGLFDPYVIDGRHYELRTRTVRSLGDDVTDTLLRAGESKSSAFSGIAIHHFHGAATRIPLGDTAFGIRSDHMVVEIVAAWDPADEGRHHRDWADTVYSELGPHSLDGGYPNLIGPGQARQADAAYGPNAEPLVGSQTPLRPAQCLLCDSAAVIGIAETPYTSGDFGDELAHDVAQAARPPRRSPADACRRTPSSAPTA